MKRLSILALALGVMASTAAEETPSEFMLRWVEAYNGNNAEVMASFYENSEEVDCLVSAGIWLRGFKEIREMYFKDMKAVRFYNSEAEQMRHRLVGKGTAVVSFIHKFKYELRDLGQHSRTHIRTTVTLRQVGTKWKIVSEHSSAIQGVERVEMIEGPPAGEREPEEQGIDEDDLERLPEIEPGGLRR